MLRGRVNPKGTMLNSNQRRTGVFLLSLLGAMIPAAHGADFPRATEVLERAVADGAFPGCTVVAGNDEAILWSAGFGHFDYEGTRPVHPATIYDLASLTKVAGTTAVLMRLVADGKLDVGEPVVRYLPEFAGDPDGEDGAHRKAVTVADLLRHRGGLTSWRPFFRTVDGYSELLDAAIATQLEASPGERYRYTDVGFILMGEIAARAGGKPLPELERELVFDPLGMTDTLRNPPASLHARIPPTEQWAGRDGFVHGVVHDENARAGEGLTGHAGLFSSAPDLASLAGELLRAGNGGSRLFPEAVMDQFTGRCPEDFNRGLGWGLSSGGGSAGALLSRASFGHTGFTGTSIWIDPEQNLYVILLSNRVHPTRDNQKIGRVRAELADAVVRDLGESGGQPVR